MPKLIHKKDKKYIETIAISKREKERVLNFKEKYQLDTISQSVCFMINIADYFLKDLDNKTINNIKVKYQPLKPENKEV